MKYKNLEGKSIDTDKQEVICPWCNKIISKELIDENEVYHDGTDNPITGECWRELFHVKCAEEAAQWRRDKYGY